VGTVHPAQIDAVVVVTLHQPLLLEAASSVAFLYLYASLALVLVCVNGWSRKLDSAGCSGGYKFSACAGDVGGLGEKKWFFGLRLRGWVRYLGLWRIGVGYGLGLTGLCIDAQEDLLDMPSQRIGCENPQS